MKARDLLRKLAEDFEKNLSKGTDYLIRGKYDISLVGVLTQMVEIKREEDADPLHIRRIYLMYFSHG